MTDRMHPRDLELLADMVADRLAARLAGVAPSPAQLVDATEIGRRFGLSRATVYERATELGAIRIGSGSRPRLRFDPEKVAEALAAPSLPASPAPLSGPPQRLRHRRSERPLPSARGKR